MVTRFPDAGHRAAWVAVTARDTVPVPRAPEGRPAAALG